MKIKTTPILFVLLSILTILLFIRLFTGAGSLPAIWELEAQIDRQTQLNNEQAERNDALQADVAELSRSGRVAIEDQAIEHQGQVDIGN